MIIFYSVRYSEYPKTNTEGSSNMQFYNVKKRSKVDVPEAKCTKVVYERKTSKGIQKRYAVRAKDDDGTNLTKFVAKEDYEKLKCKAGKA